MEAAVWCRALGPAPSFRLTDVPSPPRVHRAMSRPARPKNRRAAPTGSHENQTRWISHTGLAGGGSESGLLTRHGTEFYRPFSQDHRRGRKPRRSFMRARRRGHRGRRVRQWPLGLRRSPASGSTRSMTPCYVPSICSSSTAPTCAATHLRSQCITESIGRLVVAAHGGNGCGPNYPPSSSSHQIRLRLPRAA